MTHSHLLAALGVCDNQHSLKAVVIYEVPVVWIAGVA